MAQDKIRQIEDYARETLAHEVAHDFKHVDRVRNWALGIARVQGHGDLEVVEAAALLHDIGLPYVEKRSLHGQKGAEVAAAFLTENALFPEQKVNEIGDAIRYHNSIINGRGPLLDIIRDADRMDLFGAVGLMRALISKSAKPEYDPGNVKGGTWGAPANEFDAKLGNGSEPGDFVVDQVNFQISCYEGLATEAARRLAWPLVEFMRRFLVQLESEVLQGRTNNREAS